VVVTNCDGCITVGKGWRGIGNEEEQNPTVIEQVDLVVRRPCLPIVVCCNTRDNLNSLCSSLSSLPFLSSSALVSLKLIFFLVTSSRYSIFLIRSCFLHFHFSCVSTMTLAKTNALLS